jgi:hypothetical protein
MCAAQYASLGSVALGASSGKLYADALVFEPLVGVELEPDGPDAGDDARVAVALAIAVGEVVGEAVADGVGAPVVAVPAPGEVEPPVVAPVCVAQPASVTTASASSSARVNQRERRRCGMAERSPC